MIARQCLCQCGQSFPRRSRSLPLCTSASARLDTLITQLPLIENCADPIMARRNRVMVDAVTVAALLAGEMDEAARRVAYRAEHGLYASPDKAVAA